MLHNILDLPTSLYEEFVPQSDNMNMQKNPAIINPIAKTHQLHPSVGEFVSPPVGGDFAIAPE
jgi:hypothetical protein